MRMVGVGRVCALFELAPLLGRKCGEMRVSRYWRMHVGEIDVLGERHHELEKLRAADDNEFRRGTGLREAREPEVTAP